MWPYTGKRYFQTFPHVPHPPPMQAPPPPSYEEDSAAQAALRAGPYGMMYAYAPYQYPGQVRSFYIYVVTCFDLTC
jgi:hypothetical protein